jgi:hypothetical protein
MSIILSDKQCLQWIKDPSITPYFQKYWYLIEGTEASYYRIYKKQILTDEIDENPTPNLFVDKVKDICFINSLLRKKIVDNINEYTRDKIPRLYTLNDKWKYASEEMENPEFANTDYEMPYYTEKQCKSWVGNPLVNPRTKEKIKQNSRIYIELLYTTMQYGIDIKMIEDDVRKTSSKLSGRNNNEKTLHIINGITERLKFMRKNDAEFLSHDIKAFDKLLDVNAVPLPKKQKSKNTFDVSSLSSSSIKSLSPNEKIQLRDKIILKEHVEKKEYEYSRQKKLQKKLQKIALLHNVDKEVFTKFKKFLLTLDKGLGRYQFKGQNPVIDGILQGTLKKDNDEFMEFIRKYYVMEEYVNITDIIRGFIYNIYEQIINSPTYKLSSSFACFSYNNKYIKDFDNYPIINKIRGALHQYVDNYKPNLAKYIIKYFKYLIDDVIPRYKVFVLHTYKNGNGRDTRTKVFYNNEEYFFNNYYKTLYDNGKRIENIQYRLPEGGGFLNGKTLMRKIAALKKRYLDSKAEKVVVPDDNDLNDFTYEECQNWAMMPIINPRTFELILIDEPIYNRLLCMSYQYDCNLIPRMITSRGSLIIDALKQALKGILDAKGKPPQTREQLETYLIDRQLLKKMGKAISKFAPNMVGMKWKDYGVGIPRNRTDITANSEAFVKAFEKKIKRERIASRSSQDPVAFYVFFTKDELTKFGIANLSKDIYIKVKAHYYIPVVVKKEDLDKHFIKSAILRNRDNYNWVYKPYSIVNCMRWVMQPNKNPETLQKIATDSPEYNTIFESALLFDSNIQPIDITARGLIFKEKILKLKRKHLGIVSAKEARAARAATSKGRKAKIATEAEMAEIINKSAICESINNIYTDNDTEEKYTDFKKKMLNMCFKYLGEKNNCNLAGIKEVIFNKFVKDKEDQKKDFVYYEGSALASIIMHYNFQHTDKKRYDDKLQNIYINHYKNLFDVSIKEIVETDGKFYVIEKDALDYGGVSREFFTQLFEELFCDEENKKRPFILPENMSGSNRYYINPNFEPDENFRKVVKYVMKNIKIIPSYTTAADYVDIYKIIGKMLSIAIVNEEIGLPKQFSSYILSRFINPKKDIKYYDILYYYLKDFNNSSAYMNMMNEQQKDNIELCGFSYNDYYIISRPSESNPNGMALTKENYIKYILQLANHAVTKNFLFNNVEGFKKSMKKRYAALFSGFNEDLRLFLKDNAVTIDILDKLITNEQLNEKILLEFAENLKISVIKYVDEDIDVINDHIELTEREKEAKKEELRIYLTNIITIKREGETIEKHYEFIKRLLQFMSGFSHYNRSALVEDNGYKFFYMYGADTGRFPSAHTCFYQLDFFGFPENKISAEERETYLYEKLYEAIYSAGGMDLR